MQYMSIKDTKATVKHVLDFLVMLKDIFRQIDDSFEKLENMQLGTPMIVLKIFNDRS